MVQYGDARGFRVPGIAFMQEVGYGKYTHL